MLFIDASLYIIQYTRLDDARYIIYTTIYPKLYKNTGPGLHAVLKDTPLGFRYDPLLVRFLYIKQILVTKKQVMKVRSHHDIIKYHQQCVCFLEMRKSLIVFIFPLYWWSQTICFFVCLLKWWFFNKSEMLNSCCSNVRNHGVARIQHCWDRHALRTRYINSIMLQCWTTVCDAVPSFKQHEINVLCLI